MSSDFTQQQSVGELQKAERLSLQATEPPTQVPGYRIDRLLGQGAFGQVWVGRDLNTGRLVAIKFYLHRGGVNWSLLSREVKHLVSMSTNRHIVQVLEVGWSGEPPYYVMEYIENGSLDDLIRKRGALTVAESVRLFSDIARGLNHSHGKGVLHCDLKPANILLDHDMRPRLADFGQSRLSNEQTPSLGTLFYMAPEQADLNAVPDARWDVYALGAILHAMLVGVPPYRNATVVQQLDTAGSLNERLQRYQQLIRNSPPTKQHFRVRGIDRTLAHLIDKCIAKKPNDRFENVQQVIESLDRREELRARRPLQILGIVGPFVLLLMMALFGMRSISVAEKDTLDRLRNRALQSNQFAAMFAAKSMEREIADLFRLIEEEAQSDVFRARFTDAHETLSPWLKKAVEGDGAGKIAPEFFVSPARTDLESHLEMILAHWKDEASNNLLARLNSVFVSDQLGTTIAVAFSSPTPSDQSPVGRNFTYRSYFNGLADDAPRETTKAGSLPPTSRTHLSAPFKSTTTGTWKIAVSVPVHALAESEQTIATLPIIGVLCLTLELSDIRPLGTETGTNNDQQIAVVVDGREGDFLGTVLYHPFFESLPDSQSGALFSREDRFQIEKSKMELLRKSGVLDYNDPVAVHPLGQRYSGNWIAAVKQVGLPGSTFSAPSSTPSQSGLLMLVQERAETVTLPVEMLGSKMTREGIIALLTVLAVIGALWGVVWRLSDRKQAERKGRRQSDPASNVTPENDGTETVALVK